MSDLFSASVKKGEYPCNLTALENSLKPFTNIGILPVLKRLQTGIIQNHSRDFLFHKQLELSSLA